MHVITIIQFIYTKNVLYRKQSVLHMKTTKQQLKIIDKVCKAFSFNGIDDRKTIITRKEAALAGRIIKPLQNDSTLQILTLSKVKNTSVSKNCNQRCFRITTKMISYED